MDKKQFAFTLIELLVVIAIIGILSGLIVVSMSGVTAKANLAKVQVFSNSVKNSLLSNVIGEWKLDEGSGTAANNSWGGSNNGTLYNFTDTTAGYGDSSSNADGWMSASNCIYGTCLKFDGSDDYVTILDADALDIKNTITISLWAKIASTQNSTYPKLVNKTGSYQIHITQALPVQIVFNVVVSAAVRQTATAAILNANEWTHIVATYDGTNGKIYRDGVVKGNQGFGTTGVIDVTTNNFSIGAVNLGTAVLNGVIDDVRLYDTNLSGSQIQEQYYAGLNSLLFSGQISKEDYREKINSVAINE